MIARLLILQAPRALGYIRIKGPGGFVTSGYQGIWNRASGNRNARHRGLRGYMTSVYQDTGVHGIGMERSLSIRDSGDLADSGDFSDSGESMDS